ncbi:MAG: NUDIX hydrolase [Promethearchaeota archaeon]
MFKELLDSLLATYQAEILPDSNLQRAAVLIPIYELDDDVGPVLVFTKRSQSVRHHKGEISFPGGVQEKGETLQETALREAREELGAAPFKILGRINDFRTITDYLVSPYVGYGRECPRWDPNKEVAKIIQVPLVELLKEERWEMGTYFWRAQEFPVYYFHWLDSRSDNPVEEEIIWGATANMLQSFLSLLRSSPETMDYLLSF